MSRSPAVCEKVPSTVRDEPNVTRPEEVRFIVRLFIDVVPFVVSVPNEPEPLIVMLEVVESVMKLLLGVNVPPRVRVLLLTTRFPLVRVRFPAMVLSFASVTPDELLITVLTPVVVG